MHDLKRIRRGTVVGVRKKSQLLLMIDRSLSARVQIFIGDTIIIVTPVNTKINTF